MAIGYLMIHSKSLGVSLSRRTWRKENQKMQDFEDTRKQPDPARMHSPESTGKRPLGGDEYFVAGEIAPESSRLGVLLGSNRRIELPNDALTGRGKNEFEKGLGYLLRLLPAQKYHRPLDRVTT